MSFLALFMSAEWVERHNDEEVVSHLEISEVMLEII
jgi:hypothetical protein